MNFISLKKEPSGHWKIVIYCFILLSLPALLLSKPLNAHAATLNSDPKVVIAIDKTKESNCLEIWNLNKYTSQEHVVKMTCQPGTIMSIEIINRSQALAQHHLFVPETLSSNSQVAFKLKINSLISTERELMRSNTTKNTKISPYHNLTACGTSTSHSVSWSYSGGSVHANFYSQINYYVFPSSNCTNVNLETSIFKVTSVPYLFSDYYVGTWEYDLYASRTYGSTSNGVDFFTNQNLNTAYNRTVNDVQPKGYGYETVFAPYNGNYTWCNILVN